MTIKLQPGETIGPMSHPGRALGEEIRARRISQRELAERMGRSPTVINDIIHGRKSITPETALELEEALDGLSAQFWLNMQTFYDLDQARMKRQAVKAS
jgi:HTH-type transcriptional regulator/antitoxin HigA